VVLQLLMETDVEGLIGRRPLPAHRRADHLAQRLPHARHASRRAAAAPTAENLPTAATLFIAPQPSPESPPALRT
jgi:hypothetical protein